MIDRERHYYTSITSRLLVAFFFLSILPILAFSWIMKAYVEDTNITKLQELAISTADHRSEVISNYLKNKINLLSTLASLYSCEHFFDQKNLDHLFLSLEPKGDIVDLQVVDSSGKQHSYVGPYREAVHDKNYADAAWFKETLVNGIHVSDVFAGFRNVPHFVVAVTCPLKNFVLRATINSSIFNSLLLSAQLGPNGDAFIVNVDGQLQTPSLRANVDSTAEMPLPTLDFHKAQTIYTDSDLYTTRPLGSGHWLLVLKANIRDSLGYYIQVRNRIIAVVVIITMLSLIGAIYVSTSLSRNLELADKEHTSSSLQFAQVEKMATVGRLAAGIAHEINNPLQMITNQAGWIGELLPEEDPKALKNLDEYQKSIEQIKYHVRRAGTITHRLLGFSRKMSSEKIAVQINDLLEETVSFVEKEASYHNITIERELAADLPTTVVDGPQLQQVFLNLLNNAIDAIGQQGSITVSSRASKADKMIIEIADTGPGIKEEYLKQIFDPFFTTKDPGKGTGLGLYISYDIVQKLGGSMAVANRNSGGAVFTIILPVITVSKI